MPISDHDKIIQGQKLVLPMIQGLVQIDKLGGFHVQSLKLDFWLSINPKYKSIYDEIFTGHTDKSDLRDQIRKSFFLMEINRPFFCILMQTDKSVVEIASVSLALNFFFSLSLWKRKEYVQRILHEELLYLQNTLISKGF